VRTPGYAPAFIIQMCFKFFKVSLFFPPLDPLVIHMTFSVTSGLHVPSSEGANIGRHTDFIAERDSALSWPHVPSPEGANYGRYTKFVAEREPPIPVSNPHLVRGKHALDTNKNTAGQYSGVV